MKRNDLKMILTHLPKYLKNLPRSDEADEIRRLFIGNSFLGELAGNAISAQTITDSLNHWGVRIMPRGVGPFLKRKRASSRQIVGSIVRERHSLNLSNYGKSTDREKT